MCDDLLDLNDFYIVRKYECGWLVNRIKEPTSTPLFVSKKDLIRMGYLPGEYRPCVNSPAILVPTPKSQS